MLYGSLWLFLKDAFSLSDDFRFVFTTIDDGRWFYTSYASVDDEVNVVPEFLFNQFGVGDVFDVFPFLER